MLDKKFLASMIVVLVVMLILYYLFYLGILGNLFDECARIENPYLREKCYTDKAVEEGDTSICDNIEDEEACDSCKNEVEEFLDAGAESSGGGGDSGDDGESSGGYEIPEEGCEILSGDERDWCFRETAVEQTDPSLCLFIVDEYYMDSCYRFIAMNTGDSSYCDYMKDTKRKVWCHEAID